MNRRNLIKSTSIVLAGCAIGFKVLPERKPTGLNLIINHPYLIYQVLYDDGSTRETISFSKNEIKKFFKNEDNYNHRWRIDHQKVEICPDGYRLVKTGEDQIIRVGLSTKSPINYIMRVF